MDLRGPGPVVTISLRVALALLAAIENLELEAKLFVRRDHAAKRLPGDELAVDDQQRHAIEGIRMNGDLPADQIGVGNTGAASSGGSRKKQGRSGSPRLWSWRRIGRLPAPDTATAHRRGRIRALVHQHSGFG